MRSEGHSLRNNIHEICVTVSPWWWLSRCGSEVSVSEFLFSYVSRNESNSFIFGSNRPLYVLLEQNKTFLY